jgi:hypothetical protein
LCLQQIIFGMNLLKKYQVRLDAESNTRLVLLTTGNMVKCTCIGPSLLAGVKLLLSSILTIVNHYKELLNKTTLIIRDL